MSKPRAIIFRVTKPFQKLIVNYLHEQEIYLAELIRRAVERIYKEYEREILEKSIKGKSFWRRGGLSSRFGTTINDDDLKKLRKVSELTGRSVSDLLKEGIWKVIKESSETK
jgi:hypothetical protein